MRYVLRNVKTGKYIALDQFSGGYPYDVDDIWDAHMWDEPQRAVAYNAVMSWADYDHPVFFMEVVSTVTTEMFTPTGADLEATRAYKR